MGRAEELRRERLTALVKRNLTTILLEVTNRMFGALPLSWCHACMQHVGKMHLPLCMTRKTETVFT